jgi:mono/diheme cytochrome c family protein
MPQMKRASGWLKLGVALLYIGGAGFGAYAAITLHPAAAPSTLARLSVPSERTPTEPSTPPTPAARVNEKPVQPVIPVVPVVPKSPRPMGPVSPEPGKPAPTQPSKPELPKLSFAKQVLPIFKSKCIACHGDPLIKGGLDLQTFASAKAGGNNGDGIVAKDLMKSLIWVEIDQGTMPPSGKEKLTAAEIATVRQWILAGAPE